MRKRIRLWLPALVIALLVGVFFGGYAYGLNIYQKTMDAIGFVNITDECSIDEIEIDDAESVKVQLAPNVNTQADVTYTVHLILDGVDTDQQTTSWTAGEISSVTKKSVIFTGLDLNSAIKVKVEVGH